MNLINGLKVNIENISSNQYNLLLELQDYYNNKGYILELSNELFFDGTKNPEMNYDPYETQINMEDFLLECKYIKDILISIDLISDNEYKDIFRIDISGNIDILGELIDIKNISFEKEEEIYIIKYLNKIIAKDTLLSGAISIAITELLFFNYITQ